MMRRLAVWAVWVVGVLVGISNNAVAEMQNSVPASSANDFYYNFSHPVPADYIYRTGRVLTPDGQPWIKGENRVSVFGALFGGGKDDQGEALRLRVQGMAHQLLEHAREAVADEYVLTVSTFVNLKQLYRTSSLGRYLSEQMITELQQAGLDILEIRKTPTILMSEEFGEYSLSRDMKELDFVHTAQATVVGTYTLSEGKLFLNARLLRNSDGMILSTASQVMDLDAVVAGLLADEGVPRKAGGLVQIRRYQESPSIVAGNKETGGPHP